MLINTKFSIITVVFNNEATILDTVKSVAIQTYPNIEYLVIDGQSTDETLTRLEECGSTVSKLVSEPDQGIYDAMNKGISMASGEIIGFINADDFYVSSDVLMRVAAVFNDPDVDVCYGDLCYVNQQDTSLIVRYWQSSEFKSGLFMSGWCPPHPTFFVRKSIYEQFGGFDLHYKIAADIELMLRFLQVHHVRSRYLPSILIKMRMGGETNKSLGNIIKQNREIWQAFKKHGIQPSLVSFIGGKLFLRGKQFLFHPK